MPLLHRRPAVGPRSAWPAVLLISLAVILLYVLLGSGFGGLAEG